MCPLQCRPERRQSYLSSVQEKTFSNHKFEGVGSHIRRSPLSFGLVCRRYPSSSQTQRTASVGIVDLMSRIRSPTPSKCGSLSPLTCRFKIWVGVLSFGPAGLSPGLQIAVKRIAVPSVDFFFQEFWRRGKLVHPHTSWATSPLACLQPLKRTIILQTTMRQSFQARGGRLRLGARRAATPR